MRRLDALVQCAEDIAPCHGHFHIMWQGTADRLKLSVRKQATALRPACNGNMPQGESDGLQCVLNSTLPRAALTGCPLVSAQSALCGKH